MGLKIRARCLPKYFKEFKAGRRMTEYRQLDALILVNTETGEELELKIIKVSCLEGKRIRDKEAEEAIRRRYPDVPWEPDKPIYKMRLKRPVKE